MKRLLRWLIVLLVLVAPGCLVVTCGTTRSFEVDERDGRGSRGGAADSARRPGTDW